MGNTKHSDIFLKKDIERYKGTFKFMTENDLNNEIKQFESKIAEYKEHIKAVKLELKVRNKHKAVITT